MEIYKVLLVDDEPQILRGMEVGIQWENFGFEVIGTAGNGKEAWEMIQTNRPDVLISDIKMPFMDGLELVEIINKNFIKMKIILFSGFDDFEYAQKAIRFGVTDYLLKPVSMPQMEELLNRTHKEIEKEIEEKNNKQYLQQIYKENLPLLREQFLIELIEGRIPQYKIERRIKTLNIDFNFERCVVAVIQPDWENEYAELNMFSILNIINELFEEFSHHFLFRCYENIVLIVEVEDNNKLQSMLKCLNEAYVFAKRFMNLDFYCGVGNIVSGIEQLEYSYKSARSALKYSVVSDDENIIYIKDIENPLGENENYFDEQYYEILELSVKMADKNKIDTTIDNIFQELERCKKNFEEYQTYILELCFSLSKIASQFDLEDESFFDTRNIMTSVLSQHTGDQLKKWLYNYCVNLGYAINQKRIDNNVILAQKAKKYIDENFSDSTLSVETLCEYLHISHSHFSNIFKKVHGINFITYLTKRRIDEAVTLLKTTDYKTKVISEMVGYPESNYFSYVFKKYMNVSPANFRRQER